MIISHTDHTPSSAFLICLPPLSSSSAHIIMSSNLYVPVELLSEIFSYLDHKHLAVSKLFNAIAGRQLYGSLGFEDIPSRWSRQAFEYFGADQSSQWS